METVKLQNIIMQYDADANFRKYPELIYRAANYNNLIPMVYDPEEKAHILKRLNCVDFVSYFNCLQVGMLKKKTYAKSFKLHLIIKGKGSIELLEVFKNSKTVNYAVMSSQVISADEKTEIVLDIPDTNKPLVSFEATALEDLYIYKGWYSAEVESDKIREIKISLAITTFKREEYVKNNIALLKTNVLSEGSDLRNKIFVHIIDNGRTLDAKALDGFGIKIYPNKNVGGAGGFTRGMIEALHLPEKPTHILLMDDDVLIMTESLFRTYYLLRIVKEEYQSCFVSGAMFDYDIRERQYEDVGYIRVANGEYGPVKSAMDMRNILSVIDNDNLPERANSYAGWWYCCIPVEHIEKNGLPLPVFVRGDDVEFSLRNKAKFLTMNGICIWHVGFAGKFNAAMELYQVHRNSFVIQAASGICPEVNFLNRIKPMFWLELTRFAYSNAEQLLDSIDDFMKGPGYLETLNGEQSIKEHNQKNDKLSHISNFAQYNVKSKDPYNYKRLGKLSKLWYMITINGHLLPNFLLRKWPEVISFDFFNVPGKNFMRKHLIAVNNKDNTAVMRTINRKKCFSLIKRYRKTIKNYKKNHETVVKAYRDEFSRMTSEEFWKGYLDI